jgi:hypothetical protein
MKTFDIDVVRTSKRIKTISVTADTLEQAQVLALEQAGNYEFPNEKDADYSLADGETVSREVQATRIAASAFMSGDDPYGEYEKLLEASEDGKGFDNAENHAEVWEAVEGKTVDALIGIVDELAGGIIQALN